MHPMYVCLNGFLLLNMQIHFAKGAYWLDIHINKQSHNMASYNCSELNGTLAPLSLVYSQKSCIHDVLKNRSKDWFWVKRNTGLSRDSSGASYHTNCSSSAQGCLAVLVNDTISCKARNCSENLYFMCAIDAPNSGNHLNNCRLSEFPSIRSETMKMIQTTESVRNLYASHTASASLLDPSSNGTVSYAIAACFFAAIIAALVIIFRRKKRRQRKTRRIFNSKDDKSSTSSESLSEYSEEKTSKKVEVEMTLMSVKRAEEEQSIEEESRIYRSFPYQKESKHKTTKTGVHGSNPTYEMSLPVNTNNKVDANEVFTGKVGGNEETVSQYFTLEKREDASPMNGASTEYMEPITLSKQTIGKDDIRTHSSQMMFDDASKSKNVYSLARSDPGSNTASLLEYSKNTSNVNSYESIDTDFTDSRVSTIVQNGEQFMDSTNVYNTIEETQCNFLKHHIT